MYRYALFYKKQQPPSRGKSIPLSSIPLSSNHSERCHVPHVYQQLCGDPRVSALVRALMLSGRRRKQQPGQRQQAQPPPGSAEPAGTPRSAPRTHRGQPGTCGAQVAALRARTFHLDELLQPQPPRPEEPLGQVLLHQRGHGTRPAASDAPRAAQAATGGTSPGAAPRGPAAGPQPCESREAAARERPGGTSRRPASSRPGTAPGRAAVQTFAARGEITACCSLHIANETA